MDIGGTSPWMGEGRTMQEQLSRAMQEQLPSNCRAVAEQLPSSCRAVAERFSVLRGNAYTLINETNTAYQKPTLHHHPVIRVTPDCIFR